MWRIHRHIGMGGDQLVKAVAGDDVEQRLGDALRDAQRDEFEPCATSARRSTARGSLSSS